jgi:hypothetical protein
MTLHRVIVILRTAALGSAVLFACMGCSTARDYALTDVPVATTYVAALPGPVVRDRGTAPVRPVPAAWSAKPAPTPVRAVARPARFRPQPAAPIVPVAPPFGRPSDACGEGG